MNSGSSRSNESLRFWLHTTNSVLPGSYSHLRTMFPRRDRLLKSGFADNSDWATGVKSYDRSRASSLNAV